MSAVDEKTETEENVELPDDFFDEFEDSKFLEKVVGNVVPEESPLDVADDSNTKSSNDQSTEEDPVLKRCLDGIDNLTKSIERRKKRLREECNDTVSGHRKLHRSHSISPSNSRSDRNVRSRDRRVSPRRVSPRRVSPRRLSPRRSPSGSRTERRSKGRSRGRSRSRERNRSRDRRLSRNRRDRTASPLNQPRSMSFLEELEQKFAEQGQDFPEKNLLIKLRDKVNGTSGTNQYPVAVGYPQSEVPICMPYMHMYNSPYPPQWSGSYMMDPMHAMTHGIQHSMAVMNGMIHNNAIMPPSTYIFFTPFFILI